MYFYQIYTLHITILEGMGVAILLVVLNIALKKEKEMSIKPVKVRLMLVCISFS